MTPTGAALLVAIWLTAARTTHGGEPVFDPTTMMRLVLVPADAPVGSVVYRVRASDPDFDYPLQFELLGESGRLDISIVTLPCTRYNSVCQANVVLRRRLEAGRYVDFRMSVRTARGRTTRMTCSIAATNATTPRDTIFPHAPSLIIVPEDAKRGTELDFVIARKNPLSAKGVELELWGSPLFAIRQRLVSPDTTEGTLFLLGPLDFETQSMYHLNLLALNSYAESESDSRNIAGLEVVVVVSDVQDVAPVWREAPPVSVLRAGLQVGDAVLRVRAEDGDKGAPRQLRYGLVSEGNPFTPFFSINETTGEITLERPLEEMAAISHVGAPVLLTVVAEEVRLAGDEPEAMSSTAQLAFILPDRENTPPYFENPFYVAYLDENSPLGTALVFSDPYIADVSDNDAGKNGVFSLTLAGNNGTFEISPTVAEHHTNFFIKVRDNNYLDYEARKSVTFQIIAQELGPATNLSATANVTVYLNDVNDNPPVFLQNSYEVELAENVTAGTRVVQVAAEDVDTGVFGRIQYTAILGYLNTSLHLDPMSGIITIATNNHGFDREEMNFINFLVEARDNDGLGLRTTVPLIIKLLDVNDELPQFERSLYEFVLSPNLRNFTSPAFIKAIDKDAEPPNNIVQYEIIHGNYEEKFALNEKTGELYLLEALNRANSKAPIRDKRQFDIESEGESEVYVLTARAYDLGVPRLHSTALIKVYPPESKTRTMLFIVPGNNPDRRKTEEILSSISGGKVTILEVRPYRGNEVGATDVTAGNTSEGKSVVLATVLQSGNSIIDVSHIQQQLGARNQSHTLTHNAPPAPPPLLPARTADTASETVYKAENKLLFWLLIFLAVCIALVLLSLVFCCVCEGCPLYMPPRKRVIRVNSTDDDVHLVVREKAGGGNGKGADEWRRREAWTTAAAHPRRTTVAASAATATATKPTQWRFDRRQGAAPPATPCSADFALPPAAATAKDAGGDGRHSTRLKDGPNIIYTKEMQLQETFANKHREYMEEMENDYDRIATLHYARKQQHHAAHDDDNDSLQRHEAERGSQVYMKSDTELHNDTHRPRSPHGRDQFFMKDGNTEILRLVTRGNEEERYVNVPVPQHRPATYIPQPQYIVVDSGKDLLMQRFIREQGEEVNYMRDRLHAGDAELTNRLRVNRQSAFEGELQKANLVASMPNLNDISSLFQEVPGTIPMQSEKDLKSAVKDMHIHSHYQQELLESSIRRQNELLHQILLERNRLHNLQNHETASQFETKLETQSLPGQSVIATQTDCHISTQTEPHLLKPTRRKVRSDNDSYSEEDTETLQELLEPRQVDWLKRKKPKKKMKYKDINPRKSFRVFDVERKIRTPILEENEISLSLESEKRVKVSTSNESEEHVKNYGETKTSTLKTSENQVISSTEIKKKLNPKRTSLQREVPLEISDSPDELIDSNVKERRSRLKKHPIVDILKSDEESDSNVETNDTRKLNTNRLEEGWIDSEKIIRNIEQNSKAKDDQPNKVILRQGSSTDAMEKLQGEDDKLNSGSPERLRTRKYVKNGTSLTGTSKKLSLSDTKEAPSSVESKTSKTRLSSESDGKAIEKPTLKSVPRYMQWYNKKNAAVAAKHIEKVTPAKPKRAAISQRQKELSQCGTEIDKQGSYGKIVSKEKVDSEQKKNTKSKSEVKDKEWIHPLILKEGKVEPVPAGPAPDVHPLLQHSEHRYEHHYNQDPAMHTQPTHLPQYLTMQTPEIPAAQPLYANRQHIADTDNSFISSSISDSKISQYKTAAGSTLQNEKNVQKIKIGGDDTVTGNSARHLSKMEDDDSGIAMNSLTKHLHAASKPIPITEKKSIFTIAYDDTRTRQLRPDSSSTSY